MTNFFEKAEEVIETDIDKFTSWVHGFTGTAETQRTQQIMATPGKVTLALNATPSNAVLAVLAAKASFSETIPTILDSIVEALLASPLDVSVETKISVSGNSLVETVTLTTDLSAIGLPTNYVLFSESEDIGAIGAFAANELIGAGLSETVGATISYTPATA